MILTVPITYRDFYDVPRYFVVSYQGDQILFRSPFDDELEEYRDAYTVYILPRIGKADLEGDWNELHLKAVRCVGEVPVAEVRFDSTRRRPIEADLLDNLLSVSAAKNT